VDRLQLDYLKTAREFGKCYKKGIEVLEEIRLKSINKKGLLKK